MIKVFQIIIVGVLIYMIIKLVRLFRKYISSSRPTIDDLKDQSKKFERESRDIEDADFREIPPDEKQDSSNKVNG
jgi:hypothetical protein